MLRTMLIAWLFVSLSPAAATTAADHQRLLVHLRTEIAQRYVEVGKLPMIDRALAELGAGDALGQLDDPKQIAELLGRELKRFDQHFSVEWRSPDEPAATRAGAGWFERLRADNSGFRRVELLPGDLGYIELWGFDQVSPESSARVTQAMIKLVSARALIFDLRNNGGGSAEMVRLISSYLLPADVHLNSLYWRANDLTQEFRTLANIDGARRDEVLIFVLISGDTFSAAEEFAYNLQQLGRATIVGEVSKGGANPWQYFELGQGFRAGIPIGKAINPISNNNWEGVGVQPDLLTAREEALEVAQREAMARLNATRAR